MRRAAQIITFVSIAAAAITMIYLGFSYDGLVKEINQHNDPQLEWLGSFLYGVSMYVKITGVIAIIYAIIAGVIISTTQNLDALKVIGILSIILGFFANGVLLVGGIFTLIAVTKENNLKTYSNNTYYNNDNDYRIYR
jgi:Na+/H+ antiporter NhaC